jgi:hypothetical protein
MFQRLLVGGGRGLPREFGDRIGPQRLRRRPEPVDRLDAIANHRARVLLHRTLDDALIVIDEESARDEGRGLFLLHLVELDRADDGVGRAAPKLTLVVDRRALRAKVHRRRERGQCLPRRRVGEVPMVRQVRHPPVAGDVSWYYCPGCRLGLSLFHV